MIKGILEAWKKFWTPNWIHTLRQDLKAANETLEEAMKEKEPQKVWVVIDEWHSGEEWPDNWYINDTAVVDSIFSTEEKAIGYIIERLHEIKDEEDLDFTIPSREELQANHMAEYDEGIPGISAFRYEMYIVDYEEYKEDQHV